MRLARIGVLALGTPAIWLACGCHHRPPQTASVPPPPSLAGSGAPPSSTAREREAPFSGHSSAADVRFVESHQPLWSETGLASWYGPPYDRRRGANGEVYNQNAMTAAHRTLPMNSLIAVTNLKTGQRAVVRVTDRGPFVPGRILDLSLASAKAVGVYLPGVARVRVDVYSTPAPIDAGGRWCVQIGAFKHASTAEKLRNHLRRRYATANVIEFAGPTGYWVRIRPYADQKARAAEIAQSLKPSEGEAYLVRLD
jgi:rare lipoprotein A